MGGRRKRLRWCDANKNRDWTKVVFTDEILIQTSAHGMTWVRRPPGTRYDRRYVREVNRQGRCNINVWGAITSTGMLDLVVIDGTVNQVNYLNEVLIPMVLPYKLTDEDMIFQHDGAGAHRANTV